MSASAAVRSEFYAVGKRCPRCEERKPIEEFGVSRDRPDGRNLYCKLCINERIRKHRAQLRTIPSHVRKQQQQQQAKQIRGTRNLGFTPIERVRRAIAQGARTQREIAAATKLKRDEIGEQLAQLLLWTHEVGTKISAGRRIYFLK